MRRSPTARRFGLADTSSHRYVCIESPAAEGWFSAPAGVCRERLAVHGPGVLVAVADADDPTHVVWKPLKVVLPDYWMIAFPDETDTGWTA